MDKDKELKTAAPDLCVKHASPDGEINLEDTFADFAAAEEFIRLHCERNYGTKYDLAWQRWENRFLGYSRIDGTEISYWIERMVAM